MVRKSLIIITVFVFTLLNTSAQEALKYQLPPDEIVKIVDAPQTPSISVSPDKTRIVLIERAGIINIEDLSAEELRIAGLRIDPAISGRSRRTYNKGFRIMNIDGTDVKDLTDLPEDPALGSPVWSADGKKFVFTNKKSSTIELWVCDVTSLKVSKISDGINAVFGNQVRWLSDNTTVLYCISDPGRGLKPVRTNLPAGPVIQENLGEKGRVATYQDLLKDPVDEMIFEYFAKSQLMLWDGVKSVKLGPSGMITDHL